MDIIKDFYFSNIPEKSFVHQKDLPKLKEIINNKSISIFLENSNKFSLNKKTIYRIASNLLSMVGDLFSFKNSLEIILNMSLILQCLSCYSIFLCKITSRFTNKFIEYYKIIKATKNVFQTLHRGSKYQTNPQEDGVLTPSMKQVLLSTVKLSINLFCKIPPATLLASKIFSRFKSHLDTAKKQKEEKERDIDKIASTLR